MSGQIGQNITHGLEVRGVLLGDRQAGGLLQSHHQLHGSQGIGTQVVGQGGLGSDLLGVAAQSLHDDVAHFLEFHNSSPCMSKYQLF